MGIKQFDTLEISLDQATTYSDNKGNRYSGKIKAIQVGDFSDLDVKAYIKFVEGDELVLRPGSTHNLETIREGAVLRWDSQPSKWMNITISATGPMQSMPSAGNGNFKQDSFSNYLKSVVAVGVVPSDVLGVNEGRAKAIITNISNSTLYFGTSEDCNSIDYKTECDVLFSGDVTEFPCKAGLFFRTESGVVSDALRITEFLK